MFQTSFCRALSCVSAGCLALGAAGIALAGPNQGGVLLISAHPEVVVTDGGVYCSDLLLTDCDMAITSAEGTELIVMGVYAAFAPGSNPRVAGVSLGIQYDSSIFISSFGDCGDFELSTALWPASGEGTAVTWETARLDLVQPIYWLVGYEYYGTGGVIGMAPHPGAGSNFADDAIPAHIDPVAGFGSLGFNGAVGNLACPDPAGLGACCLRPPECRCIVVDEFECADRNGDYLGNGTACDPSPCAPCPVGACCAEDGSCSIRTEGECQDAGGGYLGDDTTCDPNHCIPIPVEESTWGRIKSLYR